LPPLSLDLKITFHILLVICLCELFSFYIDCFQSLSYWCLKLNISLLVFYCAPSFQFFKFVKSIDTIDVLVLSFFELFKFFLLHLPKILYINRKLIALCIHPNLQLLSYNFNCYHIAFHLIQPMKKIRLFFAIVKQI